MSQEDLAEMDELRQTDCCGMQWMDTRAKPVGGGYMGWRKQEALPPQGQFRALCGRPGHLGIRESICLSFLKA